MTVQQEGNIQMILPENIPYKKFDDLQTHGLSHCMKAVDFILDLPDRYIYIEFKDPQHPRSNIQTLQIQNYLTKTIDNSLVPKYRDTFLYKYASGRADKDIYYYVLIALDSLTPNLLRNQSEVLQRRIPVNGPHSTSWQRSFIKDCAIFNIQTWNQTFAQFPIQRISP